MQLTSACAIRMAAFTIRSLNCFANIGVFAKLILCHTLTISLVACGPAAQMCASDVEGLQAH